MTTDSKIYSKSWLLTPGECNCEKEMPVWLMTERIIDVATEHANSWGVGYARLILDNQAWVLSRVAIEMKRWPKVNETYTLSTWVEDYNRHFSERNIEVTDTDGNVIGHARTVWVVIDLTTRQSCDISSLDYIQQPLREGVPHCQAHTHTQCRRGKDFGIHFPIFRHRLQPARQQPALHPPAARPMDGRFPQRARCEAV